MGWFKDGKGEAKAIIYLSPEMLKQVHVMKIADFEDFQNSPAFVPGGRLLEVNRQYSYNLRQVADLLEEPITVKKVEKTHNTPHANKRPNPRGMGRAPESEMLVPES